MITNETTKNLNLAKHPFGLENGEYYIYPRLSSFLFTILKAVDCIVF
jgi:hypothetical protein